MKHEEVKIEYHWPVAVFAQNPHREYLAMTEHISKPLLEFKPWWNKIQIKFFWRHVVYQSTITRNLGQKVLFDNVAVQLKCYGQCYYAYCKLGLILIIYVSFHNKLHILTITKIHWVGVGNCSYETTALKKEKKQLAAASWSNPQWIAFSKTISRNCGRERRNLNSVLFSISL